MTFFVEKTEEGVCFVDANAGTPCIDIKHIHTSGRRHHEHF